MSMDVIEDIVFEPASKKQQMFLESDADVIVFGGAAGSGKTYMGLMRFMRWIECRNFNGYIIRKASTDMKGGGGAFDEATSMFKEYDPSCEPIKQPMSIRFPLFGSTLTFTGMDGQAGKDALHGKQLNAVMIDEATHLALDEVEWILSRLRNSKSYNPDGTPLKTSAWLTCNPDPDSFIYDWIKDYYLYPKGTVVNGVLVEGRPIPERNGDYRYYINVAGVYHWASTREELLEQWEDKFPIDQKTGKSKCQPKKFQFIGATCRDNPPLLESDPTYEGTLLNLSRIEQERLYWGNWEARQEGSGYFKREWVTIAPFYELTKDDPVVRRVRCWDLAATLESEANPNPDYTAGVLIARTRSGKYIVEDVIHGRWRAGQLEDVLLEQVRKDIKLYGMSGVTNYLPQDAGAAGKIAKHCYAKLFASHKLPIKFFKVGSKQSKLDRFLPFASAAENGLVYIAENSDWNEPYLKELEAFSGSKTRGHDDQVDGTSDSYNSLATKRELPKIPASKLRTR